jgi:hypothetical protein
MDELMLIKKSTLSGIADVIREKEGSTENIAITNLKQRIIDLFDDLISRNMTKV